MKFLLAAVLALSTLLLSTEALAVKDGERLRLLPVQDAGRVKPYDTFARETLEVVYGKKAYEGREAWQVVLTWMLAPSVWAEKELFEVRNRDIQKALNLPEDRRWFRGEEIFSQERFTELMQDLRVRRESKEKLTPYFQALQRLENQFFVFREMAQGRLLKVMPTADTAGAWTAVADLDGPARDAFVEMTRQFVAALGEAPSATSAADFDRSVEAFEKLAREAHPAAAGSATKIATEVHYNDFHPFRWAYVMYLIAALCVLMAWTFNGPWMMKGAWAFTLLGFLLHTYGFGVRVYLAGRPPVSNMYETVVWVAWGGLLFAVILEKLYKTRFILLAGNLAALVALIVADTAPAVLDPSLQPLEAVLRSNYWLIVHVMTITISYAAFLLAFVLGDIGLIYHLKDPSAHHEKIKGIVTAIYRCFQIGVAFLAPGIILGGIWADYSWGRFWGWDPKETWALIVLLGYLAVLHGRMTNWIKDFGMIVSAVVTFSLVIMAWYGVNFVLGAGLHSYGFGAGGVEYVSIFLGAHFLLVLYVWVLQIQRKKRG